MAKFPFVLGVAAGLALLFTGPVAAFADGPGPQPPRPRNFYNSPTDEDAGRPARPLAQRDDTSLYALFATHRFDAPPALTGTSPDRALVYSYLPTPAPTPAPSLAASVSPPVSRFTREDFDGAPCPTLSRDSLGALFACTLR